MEIINNMMDYNSEGIEPFDLTDEELKKEFHKRFLNYDDIVSVGLLDRFLALMGDYRVTDTEIDSMMLGLEKKYGYELD